MKESGKIKLAELSCRALADMHDLDELRDIATCLAEVYASISAPSAHSSSLEAARSSALSPSSTLEPE